LISTLAELSLTPEVCAFGAVPLGQESSRVVRLSHIGETGTLTVRGARIEPKTPELALEGPKYLKLAPGDQVDWTVAYSPTDPAPDAAFLIIEHDLFGSPALQVPISTPGQSPIIHVEPGNLDFGQVPIGKPATRQVSVWNLGTVGIWLLDVSPIDDSSPDFQVVAGEGLLGELEAGELRQFEVRYDPQGWDADTATVRVLLDGAPEVLVDVRGVEKGPVLEVSPNPIALGAVRLGETRTQGVVLANVGSLDLVIHDGALAASSSPGLRLTGVTPGELPLRLAPDTERWLELSFTPGEADLARDVASPLGEVIIHSTSALGPTLLIPITGIAGAPQLTLEPDSVGFGQVAQGLAASRTVVIGNAGERPLVVSQLTVTGAGLSLGQDGGLGAFPLVLGPGEKATGVLQLLAPPLVGNLSGALEVASNDPARPLASVPLSGEVVGSGACLPALEPGLLDFGGVPQLTSALATMTLKNQGAGQCLLDKVWIEGCSQEPGSILQTCEPGQKSTVFWVAAPLSGGIEIAPGGSWDVPIRFDAPAFDPKAPPEKNLSLGRLLAVATDLATGTQITLPVVPAGLDPTPTLRGTTGTARLDVYPAFIDFGLVPVGCSSGLGLVTLYSGSLVPASVQGLELVGCNGKFNLLTSPSLPWSLGGLPQSVAPYFEATQIGRGFGCTLLVSSNDSAQPTQAIGLAAEVTGKQKLVEVFDGDAPLAADILVVVDDSGSMGEEQANLTDNFKVFVDEAMAAEVDFRIAVTTTDTFPTPGGLQGDPPVVTPDTWEAFAANAQVGTSGSGEERGLEAAQAALDGPFAPYLRETAALVLLFVSDEDDHSPGGAQSYLASYVAAKGGFTNLVRAFAIVGPPGGCKSEAGDADAGLRYLEVALGSGGEVGSICDPSYAQSLQIFASKAFGPNAWFKLAGFPAQGSVSVKRSGVSCNGFWVEGRELHLYEGSSCTPGPGETLEVSYALQCGP
jgi:hypothetical protein